MVSSKPTKPMGHIKEQQESYSETAPELLDIEYERFEIIEGIYYDLSPAPTINHQKISANLFVMIHQACHSNATILFSPIDVYLDEKNLFQPDLVVIRHENESIIKEKRIEGAPDLVLEILSPSTSQNDKIRKKRQYKRFGVSEYWIVDPVHRTIDQFILTNGKFILLETFGVADVLTSPLMSCIHIDVSRVFPPTVEA